jgi:3-deoxy-manno-octulosonate cytidylyltransferase (CMP-KDO synthetase)
MIYAILPARYDSTRFPGKPLAMIAGKTMIERVYEQAQKASLIDYIVVATDDTRIEQAVKSFGGNVIMTSRDHKSGTDRLAEVVKNNENIDIAVNIQGDEPLISPDSIDMAIRPFFEDTSIQMTTLIRKCQNPEDLKNTNVVKVVKDKNHFALYFSRSCIPYQRNQTYCDYYLHIGLYAYRRETLLTLSSLPQAEIEQTESLEQLRALYNGISIKTVLTDYCPIGVDTPGDIEKVETFLKKQTT